MAIKTRNQNVATSVDDDVNLQHFELYRADAAASPPNHVRVRVRARNANGSVQVVFDRPLSDYSSLTGAQKTTLGSFVQSLFGETLTLEGFA